MLEYNNLDQKFHLLSQVIARIAANLISEKPDYSHINLAFDPIGERLLSRWMALGNNRLSLCLNIREFKYQWLNASMNSEYEVDITGQTIDQISVDLKESLKEFGADDVLSVPLKYQINSYSFGYDTFDSVDSKAVHTWIDIRTLANEACNRFLNFLNASSEIRIWPHHFDTGIYFEIDKSIGFGFGFAMQDALVSSPYFYLSGYALKGQFNYGVLDVLSAGRWELGDWNGAVLPMADLMPKSLADRLNTINVFIEDATQTYWNLYSN